MAEPKSIRDRRSEAHYDPEYLDDTAQSLSGSQELVNALAEFKRDRASGVLEIHFSQGGVAKIFAKVTKTYK